MNHEWYITDFHELLISKELAELIALETRLNELKQGFWARKLNRPVPMGLTERLIHKVSQRWWERDDPIVERVLSIQDVHKVAADMINVT